MLWARQVRGTATAARAATGTRLPPQVGCDDYSQECKRQQRCQPSVAATTHLEARYLSVFERPAVSVSEIDRPSPWRSSPPTIFRSTFARDTLARPGM